MQAYQFHLTGRSPLIMHFDDIEWADKISEERDRLKKGDKKNFKAGDDRCPADTWKGYAYNDETNITVPTDLLRSCLMKAGAKVTLKNNTTFKKVSQSGILFPDLYTAFTNNGKPISVASIQKISGKFSEHAEQVKGLGFRLLCKRASVGTAKHVRVRPMFSQWQTVGQCVVIDPQITEEILQEIWRIAGFYIGIGDWRPDAPKSPGPYGTFAVTLKAVAAKAVA